MSITRPRVLCPVLLEKRDLSSGLAYLPHVPDKIKMVTKRIFSETFSRMERFENSSFSFSQRRRTKSEVLEYYMLLAPRIPVRDAIVSVIVLVFPCERAKIIRKRNVWTLFFFENGQTKSACVHPDTCVRGQKTPNLV